VVHTYHQDPYGVGVRRLASSECCGGHTETLSPQV
jgi:hypothetical protein